MEMALPLTETRENFEIFVKEKMLQNYLLDNSIFLKNENGEFVPLTSNDIKVRLNNWYKVRSMFLSTAILDSFLLGISITLLILGIILHFKEKKKKFNYNH